MPQKNTPRRPTPGLISLFVSAIGLLLVSVAITYYIGLVALQNNRRLAHEVTVLQHSRRTCRRLLSMETGQRGLVLTGQQEYLDSYTQAVRWRELFSLPSIVTMRRSTALATELRALIP